MTVGAPIPLPYPWLPGSQPVSDAVFQDRAQQNFDALAQAAPQTAVTAVAGSYPWVVDVDVFGTPSAVTSWSAFTIDANQIKNGSRAALNVQNASVGWDVLLSAGTWTLTIVTLRNNNNGIYTVTLDGTTVGTIDGYNAALAYNYVATLTGLTVTSSGKKRLALTMATKNASSTGYYGQVSVVQLTRTA